jgi:hypothetical protein
VTVDARITAFSFRRQRLDGSATTALEAVASVVGVYGTNPSGPLSIHVRAPTVPRDDVIALDTDRIAVRMRAMRTSGFIVPRATAALVHASTDVPIERFGWLMRGLRLDERSFSRVRNEIVAATATPRTAQELRAAVDLEERETGPLLSLLGLHGDIVSVGTGSLTSNSSRYQARAAWLAGDEEPPDPDPNEARAWLAGEYLRAFGPARVADFAWWSGLTGTLAAAAIGVHDTVDVGDGLLLLARETDAFEATEPLAGVVTLLPKWDAWTMGYPLDGRSRFLDRAVHDRVFDGDGNGLGMVLVDGRAAGAWLHRAAGTAMAVDLDLFDRAGAKLTATLEDAFANVAGFLGYRRATMRAVDTVVPNRRRIRRPLD